MAPLSIGCFTTGGALAWALQGAQPLVLHYLYPLSLVGEYRHGMGHLARFYGPPAPEGSLQQRLYAGIDGLNYLL